jgi:hypothetical protein
MSYFRLSGEQTWPWRGIVPIACTASVPMYSRSEYYRPEHYRRLGIAAKDRAARTTDLSVKEALKDIARHWLALAERVEWLEGQYNSQQANKNR